MMKEKPSQQLRFSPGDLVRFIHGFTSEEAEIGLITRRDTMDPHEPAVYIIFPHVMGQEYHYYDLELQEWERDGTIEVQRA